MQTFVILIVWALCGIGGAGFSFAYFQGLHPILAKEGARSNLGFSLLFGLLGGPIFLIVAIFMSGFGQYGWRLR